MKTVIPSDKCLSCYFKFGEVVFGHTIHRFDSSDYCTLCVHRDSEDQKRSREYDKSLANRIHGRY
jgi:hypothetical protein